MTMNCCDHNCSQGRDCSAREASSRPAEVCLPRLDIDAMPEMDTYERIALWIAIGIACVATVAVAASALGFAYVKWMA